jgi:hypothetical protein
MKQDYEEKLTPEDLMYIRVTIAQFQANLENREYMPNTYVEMQSLKEKIDRIYRRMVNV